MRNRTRHSLTTRFLSILTAVLLGTMSGMALANPDTLSDTDITFAIESEFLYDPMVDANAIDIETHNGVVILNGTLDNLLSEERAIDLARTVKGVRSVVDKLSIEPPTVSDETLKSRLMEAFLRNPTTESYELEMTVENGIVTLDGVVDSWSEKSLSTTVARGVRGVQAVVNNATVQYPEERPDYEIASEVESRLKHSVWIDHQPLEVSVDDGTVMLNGVVSSAAEKHRAMNAAWVNGVEAVDTTGLDVQWWRKSDATREFATADMSDADVKQAVNSALTYDPRVFSFHPDVTVQNGVVTLSGTVDNLQAKWAAEETAENTRGVRRVVNYLKVRPGIVLDDTKLVSQIDDAYLWDPIPEPYELTVTARNGDIWLSGTVDSYAEKVRAENLAAAVNGVISVNNNLVVEDREFAELDWEIREDIESELFWNPEINAANVAVSVDDGTAILTGTVDHWQAVWSATQEAYEGGAIQVRNQLNVRNNDMSAATSTDGG